MHASNRCGKNWDEEKYSGKVRDVGVSRKENAIKDRSWDIQKNCKEIEEPEVGSLGTPTEIGIIE